MKGPEAFRPVGRGAWTYLSFRVRRSKGDRFASRVQVYRTDVVLDDGVVTLSAQSLSELKWEIDRLVGEGGVPSVSDPADSGGADRARENWRRRPSNCG